MKEVSIDSLKKVFLGGSYKQKSQQYYNFKIPGWSYKDFIEENDLFRKGITSIGGEPGWFYFKIFFHFDETWGLLSNILTNNDIKKNGNNNSALNYLRYRENTFAYDNIIDRKYALIKFVEYLSFINCNAPWFFDKIIGLNEVIIPLIDLNKEKTLEISCFEDAVDMRLMSLFHLYQYACFDEINMKEIIPENLRKFNMTVVLFHIPIREFDTAIYSDTFGSMNYKSLNGDNNENQNRMGFKMFTFKGCEFDLSSINQSLFGNAMDNAQAFNIGKSSFKIKYDRVFTHIMNSWEQFMVGPDGFYYDNKNNMNYDNKFSDRINAIITNIDNKKFNKYDEVYKELIESVDDFISHKLLFQNTIGNIYGNSNYDGIDNRIYMLSTNRNYHNHNNDNNNFNYIGYTPKNLSITNNSVNNYVNNLIGNISSGINKTANSILNNIKKLF